MRERIASWLVRLAFQIYPESEDVKKFHMKVLTDQMISGQAFVTINPEAIYKQG